MSWTRTGLGLLAVTLLGVAACPYLLPKTDEEICEDYCDRRIACEVEDASGREACQASCLTTLEAGGVLPARECNGRITCDRVQACITCIPYCDKFVSCSFDTRSACEASCEDLRASGAEAYGEACVIQESCDQGSLCILCDQYCRKLQRCGLSVEPACVTSCVTLLQAGADDTKYVCVVESTCEEVPNCGI